MKKDSAILGFILAIFTIGFFWIIPIQTPNAQPVVIPVIPPVVLPVPVDSVEILKQQADQKEQAALNKGRQVSSLTAQLNRVRRAKRIVITKEAEMPTIALRINNEVYEVQPDKYKGYLIIDVDSIQREIVEEEIDQAILAGDSLSTGAIQHANEQIGLWQKFKSFFKRKK